MEIKEHYQYFFAEKVPYLSYGCIYFWMLFSQKDSVLWNSDVRAGGCQTGIWLCLRFTYWWTFFQGDRLTLLFLFIIISHMVNFLDVKVCNPVPFDLVHIKHVHSLFRRMRHRCHNLREKALRQSIRTICLESNYLGMLTYYIKKYHYIIKWLSLI